MGKSYNVNDNVSLRESYNVNDNVRESESFARRMIVKDISEYKLKRIQEFLYKTRTYDSSKDLLNPAVKQISMFVHMWYTELEESERKAIATMMLEIDGDGSSRPYKDYTESPIWKYTSSIIKTLRGYTCERCKNISHPAHLVVHHKRYDHIGSELQHLDDIELLCTDCHMEEHGIRRSK